MSPRPARTASAGGFARVGPRTAVRTAIEAPGRADHTLVGPLTASLSSARFLAGDNGPGSSVSSDTEEDTLPANKCKKVWSCVLPRATACLQVGGPTVYLDLGCASAALGMTDPASCRAGQQSVQSHPPEYRRGHCLADPQFWVAASAWSPWCLWGPSFMSAIHFLTLSLVLTSAGDHGGASVPG